MMEVVIEYDACNDDLCSSDCKWLMGGGSPPFCYLFGELALSPENRIPRAQECIDRAEPVEESPEVKP